MTIAQAVEETYKDYIKLFKENQIAEPSDKVELLFEKAFKGIVNKRVIGEHISINQNGLAKLSDWSNRLQSISLETFIKSLRLNGLEVEKFIIENCSEKKKDKVKKALEVLKIYRHLPTSDEGIEFAKILSPEKKLVIPDQRTEEGLPTELNVQKISMLSDERQDYSVFFSTKDEQRKIHYLPSHTIEKQAIYKQFTPEMTELVQKIRKERNERNEKWEALYHDLKEALAEYLIMEEL